MHRCGILWGKRCERAVAKRTNVESDTRNVASMPKRWCQNIVLTWKIYNVGWNSLWHLMWLIQCHGFSKDEKDWIVQRILSPLNVSYYAKSITLEYRLFQMWTIWCDWFNFRGSQRMRRIELFNVYYHRWKYHITQNSMAWNIDHAKCEPLNASHDKIRATVISQRLEGISKYRSTHHSTVERIILRNIHPREFWR